MYRTALVAIGGNSLIPAGEPTSVATQRLHLAATCRALAHMIGEGWSVIVTHGNGPQVGAALRRSELGSADAYPLPLDMCVAGTQGEIGVLLQRSLHHALAARGICRPVAAVLTQVVVSSRDPAFTRPTKPVGPFYLSTEARSRAQAGWTMVEEPPHGYRRAVPSPEPLEIVEEAAIRALVADGVVVIALGGGGVPVVVREGQLEGVEAVVDKDLASALLASHLHVDVFLMSTDVDRIYVNYAHPDASGLELVSANRLRCLASDGQFPAGTMGPKVEAALRFLAAGGHEAIVTSPDRIVDAVEGRAGTHIVNEEQPWIVCAR